MIADLYLNLGRVVGTVIAVLIGLGIGSWLFSLLSKGKRRAPAGGPPPLPLGMGPASAHEHPGPSARNGLTPAAAEDRVNRILKRVRRIELITRGLVKETIGGQYHSRFKGQGIEFDDFREYQAGDDVRFLDWNVTARMNEPYIRKYVEEREMSVMLLVDVSRSGDYGSGEDSKRERMAEIAAVFAFSAQQNQDKVGLALFSSEVEFYLPPRKGSAQALRVVREILNYQPRRVGTDFTQVLDLTVQRIPHRALVFIISDFLTGYDNRAWEKPLRAAASKHDVVAVQVLDPRELQLPRVGRMCLEDPETGEQVIVNTSDPFVRQTYHQRVQGMQDNLSGMLSRNRVERVAIETSTDYLPALRAYFRSRKRR